MTGDFPARVEDRVVGGIYRLGAVLHQSAESAVYETDFGEDARPAAIKIRWGERADSERVLARWRNAIALIHPNLLRVYAAGNSVLDDVPVLYMVMERADESLAGVLAERAASGAETLEMLTPTLSALSYLHKNGYVHSNLKPSNILAVGDSLKLSSDSVTRIGEGGAPADDMWALGAVIVQALTREAPKMEENSGPYILRDGPQELTDIVRHCLDPDPEKRWTADEVAARLDPQPVAPAMKDQAPQVREARATERRVINLPTGQSRKLLYGALAALVLVAALVGFGRKSESGPVAVPSIPAANPPVAASPLPPPVPKHVRPIAKTVVRTEVRRAEGWSVVVASYGSRPAAEKREHDMARKWPKFNVSVFEQRAQKTYYLVVIGQNLSEDRAEALRKRAVASGLPHDTYIKKFL